MLGKPGGAKKKAKRRIILALADMHSGHKLGLCNPDTILWDEGPDGQPVARRIALGKTQEYLWELCVTLAEEVKEFAAGGEIILLYSGDLTHGIRFSEGLIASTVDEQTQIGFWNLKPWFALPRVTTGRLILGTPVHTFDGSSEAIVARLLRAEYPRCDIKAISHGLLQVDEVVIDVAHHGPFPGSRVWLEGNQPRYYLRDLMWKEIQAGGRPPDVVLRAHYHVWLPPETMRIQFQGVTYESHLVLLPSLCGMSAYARKSTQSAFQQTHGVVGIEIVEGRVGQIRPFIRTLDIRTKEVLGGR
ncbi:MAG: hypothetical protein QHJ81_14735 [Anaerolineae bacterium]|nr:hypothetical protein [Anaerolineae bacterium]